MIIFEDFGRTEKKLLLLALSLLFCYWLVSGSTTVYASEMYQITEAELSQLETNLSRLEQISSTQKTELTRLRQQLAQSQEQLQMLKAQLNTSAEQLTTAQNSLDSANKLLQEFAQEEKNKRLRIKAQRNTYFVLMVAAAVAAVCHR
jgi:septal ring factor EnvC (AmiA/AmiB activator)